MEGKTVKEWVETKRTEPPPPPVSTESPVEPHMVGIPQIGDEILGGKYRVERVIGLGGMGVVVSAMHKQLGHPVAIKFLSATMQTPELVDRFIREGQAAVRIKSEHIAPVLDVGVLENGTPYLMMEHLTGADLSDYLASHGAVPITDAVDFILQTCDALAVAHAAGIIHRDLKPSNLFVTQRYDGSPLIKVLDFGISKITQQASLPNPKSTLTRPGTMLGSPRYMSPEQLRNASSVDYRADIWALGIVLHELVAGSPPYDADTFVSLCAMIATEPPKRLRDVVPEAPELLEAIILKCVEKDPANRWSDVAELAYALAPLAPEESRVIASRVGKVLGKITGRTPPGMPSSQRTAKPSGGADPAHATDRTQPLPPTSGTPPGGPAPTPPPVVSGAPASGGTRAVRPPESNAAAALAVSQAKAPGAAGGAGKKIATAIGAIALIGVGAVGVSLIRGPTTAPNGPRGQAATGLSAGATATPSAAAATTPSAAATAVTSAETLASAVPSASVASTASAETTASAAPALAPIRRPHGTTRPAVLPSTSAPAPPSTSVDRGPSETDMLNRRR